MIKTYMTQPLSLEQLRIVTFISFIDITEMII